MVYRGLPDDFLVPIDSPVDLCRDDGFVLRTDNPADYLRQTFCDGVLTLTNTPEPEPVGPVEPEPSTEEILLEIAADHEARLCEIEMGV